MEFIIQDITKFDTESGLIGAKAEFNLLDEAGDIEVVQGVSIDLRIQCHDDITLSQLEEMLLKKATDQLRAVLSKCEGKTAHELRLQSEKFASLMSPDE